MFSIELISGKQYILMFNWTIALFCKLIFGLLLIDPGTFKLSSSESRLDDDDDDDDDDDEQQ